MKKVLFGIFYCLFFATSFVIAQDADERFEWYDEYFPPYNLGYDFRNFNEFNTPGGAVINEGYLGKITGDFINNNVIKINDYYDYMGGGAIANNGYIASINSTFKGNSYIDDYSSFDNYFGGGAIYNIGYIGSIKGSFEDNYSSTFGGAIYNTYYSPMPSDVSFLASSMYDYDSGIDNINAEFKNNVSGFSGGAITNDSYIGEINSSFKNNEVRSNYYVGAGGAIDNESGFISKIESVFDSNKITLTSAPPPMENLLYEAPSQTKIAMGGAINNAGEIGEINEYYNPGIKKGTSAVSTPPSILDDIIQGGIINSKFSNNSIEIKYQEPALNYFISGGGYSDTKSAAAGGAINNSYFISQVKNSSFENNKVEASISAGGALSNVSYGVIESIVQDGYSQDKESLSVINGIDGYASMPDAMIGRIIDSSFLNNKVIGEQAGFGGAIVNAEGIIGEISNVTFKDNIAFGNQVAGGGAIANEGLIGNPEYYYGSGYYPRNPVLTMKDLDYNSDSASYSGGIKNSNFINNKAIGQIAVGGAIANVGQISEIKNSNFIENSAEGDQAAGGAIFTTESLRITADNDVSIFDGNYTISHHSVSKEVAMQADVSGNIIKDNNAIYVAGRGVKGTPALPDPSYSNLPSNPLDFTILNLNSENKGTLQMNDNINGQDYSVILSGDMSSNINLNDSIKNAEHIVVYNTNVNMGRDDIFNESYNLTLSGGRLSMVNNSVGQIYTAGFMLNDDTSFGADVDLKNEVMDTIEADEYYINPDAKLNVDELHLISHTDKDNVKIYFAPQEFSQNVEYTGSKQVAYSPIYRYNIGYSVDETDNMGYFNFSKAGPSNRYSSYNPSVFAAPAATQSGYVAMLNSFDEAFRIMDSNMLMPSNIRQAMRIKKLRNKYAYSGDKLAYDSSHDNSRIWARPYTVFETVPLKNGPKVNNVSWGSFFGTESDIIELKNNTDFVWGVYGGYNGSRQSYDSVSMYQNGGTLGALGMLYKGNLFSGLTFNVGASGVRANTMYGHEDFGMFMTGVASKTGYNFEFKEGKFIIQPNILLSYSFVNTFDYTNASGLKVKSDGLNAFQVEPGIKFVGNLGHGWQPYLMASFVWNFMDKAHFRVNDVSLPSLSIKPYVKYGAGVSKIFNDSFTGYLQTYITQCGRNGVGLQAGLNWFF